MERDYDSIDIKDYAERGYNIGFRLGRDDLVIDVDPRNGGDEGLKRLCDDWWVSDLADVAPSVITGGGGWHYYFKIDPRVKTSEVPKNEFGDELYPGIEFKRFGRQVIIPGSIHYDAKRYYELDQNSPCDKTPPPVSTWLVEVLAREIEQTAKSFSASPRLSDSELSQLLEALPVDRYNTNDRWLPILMSAHHATAGEGLDAFLAWSLADPNFTGHKSLIKRRWASLSEKQHGVTYATLFKAVRKNDGFIPRAIQVKADFADSRINEPRPAKTDEDIEIVGLETEKKKIEKGDREDERAAFMVALQAAEKLSQGSTTEEIDSVLKRIVGFPPIDIDSLIRTVATRSKRSRPSVRDEFNRLKVETIGGDADGVVDVAYKIAEATIHNKFKGGRLLRYGVDDRFWHYQKGVWRPVPDMNIKAILTKRIKKHMKETKAAGGASSILAQAFSLVGPMLGPAVEFNENHRRPVINCANGEVWTKPNGRYTFKKHKPENNLTHRLDIPFEKDADCLLFKETLNEIFKPLAKGEREDTIRHLLEVLGYIIQPVKNLSAWVMFQGDGANGKGVLLEVLQAILGDAALSTEIALMNPMANKHAFADLPGKLAVIDDDLKARSVLPDSTLKKLSENKPLQANPKNKTTFRFYNTAICLIASNHWPTTRDLTHGMRRRAYVFRFDRIFDIHDIDPDRARNIIDTELTGVLNLLLSALRRLRNRGRFQPSLSCTTAKNTWLRESSQIQTFVEENFSRYNYAKTPFADIWNTYIEWTMGEGVQKRHTKTGLRKSLSDIGLSVTSKNNKTWVWGIKPH
jgi:P4 family phage/plasmid primase-like protien